MTCAVKHFVIYSSNATLLPRLVMPIMMQAISWLLGGALSTVTTQTNLSLKKKNKKNAVSTFNFVFTS